MTTADILGVLGFVLALVSTGWQIHTHRARLRVRPVGEDSGFFTAELSIPQPGILASNLVRTATLINLRIDISNNSQRHNTVVSIGSDADAPLQPLADDTVVILGHRDVAPILGFSEPRMLTDYWACPPRWNAPIEIPVGSHRTGWLAYEWTGGEVRSDTVIPHVVIVRDAYGHTYRKRIELVHRPPVNVPGVQHVSQQ